MLTEELFVQILKKLLTQLVGTSYFERYPFLVLDHLLFNGSTLFTRMSRVVS